MVMNCAYLRFICVDYVSQPSYRLIVTVVENEDRGGFGYTGEGDIDRG